MIHLVDAADTSKSNWLRYINCPPTEDDENLSYLQKNGKVYYRTKYMIPAGKTAITDDSSCVQECSYM